MKFVIPKTNVKVLTYSLALIGALYFIAPELKSQATTDAPPAKQEQNAPAKDAPANTDAPADKKAEEKVAPPKKSPGLIDLFFVGGWSMWPLLFASIIGFGVALERMYFFYSTKLVSKGYNQDLEDAINEGGIEAAKKFIEGKGEEKISMILSNGIDVSSNDPDLFAKGVEREAAEVIVLLEKGLTILASVSTIAPLIGFLGTVSGMINAFDAIANADQVNAKVVAGGIKEALITTAAGLIVALPAMSFYQILTGKVNSFAADVEEAANKVYKEFLRAQGKSLAGK
ncbi:MAG: MotA/TolQ/ExbB proton channel family protein [Leptospiraceae bacterium]|nr:MotA/TolQ/ExbB proton channel family protein [Leptospiraceae bacterium]